MKTLRILLLISIVSFCSCNKKKSPVNAFIGFLTGCKTEQIFTIDAIQPKAGYMIWLLQFKGHGGYAARGIVTTRFYKNKRLVSKNVSVCVDPNALHVGWISAGGTFDGLKVESVIKCGCGYKNYEEYEWGKVPGRKAW